MCQWLVRTRKSIDLLILYRVVILILILIISIKIMRGECLIMNIIKTRFTTKYKIISYYREALIIKSSGDCCVIQFAFCRSEIWLDIPATHCTLTRNALNDRACQPFLVLFYCLSLVALAEEEKVGNRRIEETKKKKKKKEKLKEDSLIGIR